jgi:F-type H+-transporting ATPase subunit b
MTTDRLFQRILCARVQAWLLAAFVAAASCALLPAAASAQEHAATAAPAATHTATEAGKTEADAGEGVVSMFAKLLNFAVLAGVLVYFLKSPVTGYLASRGMQIRQDLVTAREMRAAAQAQLAQVEQRLRELPAELEALKARGAEDLRSEQARITEAVAAERARLVEQTRRDIEMRLRVARRDLTEHAAQLAVSLAEQRIRRSMTADDQLRLIDRYTTQLKEAR